MIKQSPAPIVFSLFAAVLSVGEALGDDNWTNFRGPNDQGHVAAGAKLPVHWSETENIVWKTEVSGKAWSSPVIWGDRVWLTNASADGTWLAVICVDKRTGEVVMDKRLHDVRDPQACHNFNSYASPSPVIEDGRLYVSFGSPYNACLDSETGQVIWERTDFICNHFRGPGSSPFLYENLLIIHFDGSDQQYVVALDKGSGRTIWRTDRSIDFQDIDPETGGPRQDGDYRKAFSTPVISQVSGRPLLISLGSKALYAYEPRTGREVWRMEALGSHSGACRPVTGHGLVFAPLGSGGDLRAIHPDAHGLLEDAHIAWTFDDAVCKRPSLLLVDEKLFMVNDSGVATCLEAITGKELWQARIGNDFSASPIYSEGKIWLFDQEGKATVIAADSKYRKVAQNQLDEGCMASPAVSGNALYVRTRTHLYRIQGRD